MTTQRAKDLATATADAYSADAYRSWAAVAQAVLGFGKAERGHGLTEAQTEAVLRSKWTRWARDHWEGPHRYGRYPAEAVIEYLAGVVVGHSEPGATVAWARLRGATAAQWAAFDRQVAELVEGTFATGRER